VTNAHWAASVLYNGLARYEEAAWAARQATSYPFELVDSVWALPELVEAAVRRGEAELARDALERLAESTQPSGTDFGLGIEARSRALLSDGAAADGLYREAIDRLGRTRLRPELARAHLLYGEWLRRENRRVDAREQLRIAHDLFAAIGMEAFAERARTELLATGETARKRTVDTGHELTAQEAVIARLARDGLSNPEIGTRLFLSARTVQYHLGKVFAKLDISSRAQLDRALPGDPATARSLWPADHSVRCRAPLASRTGHWRMRTQAGANETWRAAGTVSTPQFSRRIRTIDGLSVGLSLHR
jgi:DNA-binding CsgD family transcriptional regulator